MNDASTRPEAKRSALVTVLAVCAFAALLAANLVVQQLYVDRSRGPSAAKNASFVQIPGASPSHLLDRLAAIRKELRNNEVVVTDSANTNMQEIESAYMQGHSFFIPSIDLFGIARYSAPPPGLLQNSQLDRPFERLSAARTPHFKTAIFGFSPTKGNVSSSAFSIDDRIYPALKESGTAVLVSSAGETALNRWNESRPTGEQVVALARVGSLHNHLVFVNSSLGQSSFISRSKLTNNYTLEPDSVFPNSSWAGFGRYMLVQIINPAADVRVELSLSDTIKGDGQVRLPPAKLYGDGDVAFPMFGRGSGRVLSPILKPRRIDGNWYFLIDAGLDGTRSPQRRLGIMNMFGRNIVFDPRYLTGYLRDLSVISNGDIEAAPVPSAVSSFPSDLQNKYLFYSGLYEDGWASEHAAVRLLRPLGATTLEIKGSVPMIERLQFKIGMNVRLDGTAVIASDVNVGSFDIRVPLSDITRSAHTIDIRFSNYQRLPGADRRPVSAKFSYIGFNQSGLR